MRLLLAFGLVTALGACVNQTVKSTSVPAIQNASVEVPEGQLLDVGIAIFDPGLEEYEEGKQIYPEVRKAEARYMPNLLAEAMQESGAWGAVRVVPGDAAVTDLLVEGEILHSNGEELQLLVTATDSRGIVWLNRKYTGKAGSHPQESLSCYRTFSPPGCP